MASGKTVKELSSIQLQHGTENEYYVTWSTSTKCSYVQMNVDGKKNVKVIDHYKVKWYFATGDGVWFDGSSEEVTRGVSSVYTPPENALKIKVSVKPVAKKRKVNGKETSYYTGSSKTKEKTLSDAYIPAKPTSLSTTIEKYSIWSSNVGKYKITASLDNINDESSELNNKADHIEFCLYDGNKQVKKETKKATVATNRASASFTVEYGQDYRVRCRAINNYTRSGKKKTAYSDWSDYSNVLKTAPKKVTKIVKKKATSSTSVSIDWERPSEITAYVIEYTLDKEWFDSNPSQVSSVTISDGWSHAEITGLETGKQYFFRIKAVNDGATPSDSDWSDIFDITLGIKPNPPTTWSSTTTAITPETVNLYWVHNAEDNSTQTKYQIKLIFDGDVDNPTIITGDNPYYDDEFRKDETLFYELETADYLEGTKIEWCVRTAGIKKKSNGDPEYSDWSITRVIDVYNRPAITLSLDGNVPEYSSTLTYNIGDYAEYEDTIYECISEEPVTGDWDSSKWDELSYYVVMSYPLTVYTLTGSTTQNPLTYHYEIISNENYETVNDLGELVYIQNGDVVYSKDFDGTTVRDTGYITIGPSEISLDDGISYSMKCTASFDSGITSEDEIEFLVSLEEVDRNIDANVSEIDEDNYSITIMPYVEIEADEYDEISTYNKGDYVKQESTLYECISETSVTGEWDSSKWIEKSQYSDDYLLSVYRREYDNSFKEISIDDDSELLPTVTDLHPALDYARYRIVAKSKTTGSMLVYDIPAIPVGCKEVILQWDEKWRDFEMSEENAETLTETELKEDSLWSSSIIKLPYNIDVSESNRPDVSLVQYIGHSNPVSYYGTHLGVSATWNVEIPRYDTDTLYALRRLSAWMGDVYVREPSGVGYWANVLVSMSQKHCELTIPVTLTLTKVEGGA